MTETPGQRATRESYDAMAADYEEYARGDLEAKPLDRAMLAAFAATVRSTGGGRSPTSAAAPAGSRRT
jgi:hypothetical protein